MTTQCEIAIVGGGLAGLAAARALASLGREAHVFEQAPALGEIGAAVNTSPNATKALQAIGLGEQIAAVGNRPTSIYARHMQTGETLGIRDLRQEPERYGASPYTFHRADLLDVLAASVDPASIHLDRRLTAIAEHGDKVTLGFANGAAIEADCVIAADGIRSVVRQALYGDDNPSYTGQMVWRALLKGRDVSPDVLEPNSHVQWVGAGCHFIAYYMRGTELVNIVTQEDTDKWVEEGWSTRGDPDEMRLSFPDPEPRMAKILSLVTECSKWGLFTRPLTGNWGRGRVQLIGDAAHAMLPNAGQGACQAFEDAYILARWVASCTDTAEAFANFRRIRVPRVHAVQRLSIANARLKHMRDASAQKAAYASAAAPTKGGPNNTDWVRGFDPVTQWDTPPVVPEIELPMV